ncbi:hypothetical protein [Methylobacterium komagatae]
MTAIVAVAGASFAVIGQIQPLSEDGLEEPVCPELSAFGLAACIAAAASHILSLFQ